MPTLTALLHGFASQLTDIENYETTDGAYAMSNVTVELL
jgi:hypothetical protein